MSAAEDAELPDMVPITISTTLPEFSNQVGIDKVLAGVLLTWEEFLNLFNVRPDPSKYYIKGSNGAKLELEEQIQVYIDSFKKKLRFYPVTLEKIDGISGTNSTTSENSAQLKETPNISKRTTDRSQINQGKRSSISTSISEKSVETGISGKERDSGSSHQTGRNSGINKRKSTESVRKGRKPRQKKPKVLEEDHVEEEQLQKLENQSSSVGDSASGPSSDESNIEEVPSKDRKKLLKQEVIKYLTEKVSPRSFMRLRNELMNLRDHEKYFKVTSVVPMTAGLMEQAFCRKLV